MKYIAKNEPQFYENVETAAKAAFGFIKQVYPETPECRLMEFLKTDL